MRFNKKDINLYFMLLSTLILPLLVGLLMQNYSHWRFVSVPLHSFLETAGGIIALIISIIIFMIYYRKLEFTHFHRASLALISMGIFDIFHAMTTPGELFVWLHSLAIFYGGLLFALVWVPNYKVSKRTYLLIPFLILSFSILVSIISLANPNFVPKMLTENKEFTNVANLLNIIGGTMFVATSFYFIRRYLEHEESDDLLFAGHTMLFGSAGLLFFFSSIWDMQWWFWHTLRLIAYVISLYFMLRVLYINIINLEVSNQTIKKNNKKLNKAVTLLKEYKNAVYQGSIISTADLEGKITFVNKAFEDITGYTASELLGKPHSIIRDPDTPKSTFQDMWETIKSGDTYKGLIKNKAKSGESFYVKITVVPIKDENGIIFEYLALRDNVTELVKSQKELKSHFYTDSLTKLHNRYKFNEDVEDLEKIHIALLNINNLKNINDFYGQHFGDEIIQNVANILLNILHRDGYNVYRNHGDEYLVVSKDPKNFESFEADIKSVLDLIENKELYIENQTIEITLSAGLCKLSNDIVKADLALKEAKRKEKSLMIYNDALDIEKIFEKNIEWSKKIKQALNNDMIDVALQPIYSNNTKQIEKYESLVRLIEKDGSVISPYQFLDVAKRTKLYSQITKRVAKKTFTLLHETEASLSINICADDIFNDSTRYYIINLLKETPYPHRITFELVESEGIENFSVIKEFIDEAKGYGAKFAIDDFGTGYSNFEYLLRLNVNYIKIDGSLIKNIDTNSNNFNVVESIVNFGKKNGMQIIAEFVSTESIQKKIEELDIEYSQGYFIDKPKFWDEIS